MLKNVKYVLTTHDLKIMPNDDLKEIVIVGKSNVGKSTFINVMTNNSKLAKISSKPGKTRAISFFSVDDKYRLVDIPGYGYAKVSKQQLISFAKMIEQYFKKRENIEKVILLLDVRRGLTNDDREMINYFFENKISFAVIGTKLDKAKQQEVFKFNRDVKKELSIEPLNISLRTKVNVEKALEFLKI